MHNTRAAISLNRNKLNRPNLRYGGDETRSMRLIFEAITNKRYLHAKQTNTNEATFTIALRADDHFNVGAIMMRRILISDIKDINKHV